MTLVVDANRGDGFELGDDALDIAYLDDLGIEDLEVMQGIYDQLEFSTAVKPWLLDWMLRRFGDDGPIAYFDPDIEIHSRMPELEEILDDHWIALTPHLTRPNPLDGEFPTEQVLLLAGVYNLGFLAIRESDRGWALLEWWKERLARDCVVNPPAGFFVDQRFVDFVPGLFDDVGVLRHEGYNAAYWNLATRELSHSEDGSLLVNGQPARFLHFSGFDARWPDKLSKHQSRIDVKRGSTLAAVLESYAESVIEAGYRAFSDIPYGLGETASGRPLPRWLRAVYRDAVDHGFRGSLFDEADEVRFVEFSLEARSRLAIANAEKLREWIGLSVAFGSDLEGGDLGGLDPERVLRARTKSAEAATEFNLLLDRTVESPVSALADGYAAQCESAGVALWRVDLERNLARDEDGSVGGVHLAPLVFTDSVLGCRVREAERVMRAVRDAAPALSSITLLAPYSQSALSVAQTGGLARADQILTDCSFGVEALESHVESKVTSLAAWLAERALTTASSLVGASESASSRRVCAPINLDDPDALAIVRETLDVFAEAAIPYSSLVLALDGSAPAATTPTQVQSMVNEMDIDEDQVHISIRGNQVLDSLLGVIARSGILLSLHREIGFGFPLAVGMALGRPLVATARGGLLEYADNGNSVLVPQVDDPESGRAKPDHRTAAASLAALLDGASVIPAEPHEIAGALRNLARAAVPKRVGAALG